MKFSTVIGGGLVFIAGMGTGVYIACKAAVAIDEKICKGKLREKFLDSTSEKVTTYMHKKFEPKSFKPRKFEYSRFNTEQKYRSPKDIVFTSQSEAEEVRLKFNDLIGQYSCVSVADLFDLTGMTTVYTDTLYGWTKGLSDDLIITNASGGWIIDFPDVCEL